jgi:hypothetical protein
MQGRQNTPREKVEKSNERRQLKPAREVKCFLTECVFSIKQKSRQDAVNTLELLWKKYQLPKQVLQN